MKCWDLCVIVKDRKELEERVKTAEKLGWDGLGILTQPEKLKEMKARTKKLKKEFNLDLSPGVFIEEEKLKEVRKSIKDSRKKAELIVVFGGNLRINREVVDNPMVDVLLNPWFERRDPGVDKVIARQAAENDVALALGFNQVLYSYKKGRVNLITNVMKAVKLAEKFESPFVLTSGAVNRWELRGPLGLISLGQNLGMEEPENSLSGRIVEKNRKRLSEGWVMPGVEVEK